VASEKFPRPRFFYSSRVPQELWSAASIAALTQGVGFSQSAGILHKMSEITLFDFPKSSPMISRHLKAAMLTALQRLRPANQGSAGTFT